jgi:hypothetical protein
MKNTRLGNIVNMVKSNDIDFFFLKSSKLIQPERLVRPGHIEEISKAARMI